MRILFFGDVVGKSGRTALSSCIEPLKLQYNADFVIVNGENSAHGKGITKRIYDQFMNAGIDCITLGNHAFSKKDILNYMDECSNLVYPNNHPLAPNKIGMKRYTVANHNLVVINVMANAFMLPEPTTSPFTLMNDYLSLCTKDDLIFVDLHGEATAEKRAFFELYKDKCIAIVGTHTHVQTADEMVKDGCAFISDVGMVGAYDSILGRDISESLQLYLGNKTRYVPSENSAMICAVCIDIDDNSLRATSIERIQIRP